MYEIKITQNNPLVFFSSYVKLNNTSFVAIAVLQCSFSDKQT